MNRDIIKELEDLGVVYCASIGPALKSDISAAIDSIRRNKAFGFYDKVLAESLVATKEKKHRLREKNNY